MMELKVKEFAAREQVSERTVRHWMAKGAVSYRRTPGGHIRIIDSGRRVAVLHMQNPEEHGKSSG